MKILFISNITPLQSKATSTDIMTYNIIYGLSKISDEITIVAINNSGTQNDETLLKECYNKIASKIFMVKSKIGKNKGKYSYLSKLYFNSYLASYKKEYEKIKKKIDENTILVSHAPSLESIFLCEYIKKHHPKIRWIQYWSDPIALSGINPEKYGLKRYPYYFIEKKCLKHADKIVYGTKTLYDFQKEMFKNYISKMTYIDIPYSKYGNHKEKSNIKNGLLYAGNFFSYTRNIMPLYEAINRLNGEFKLNVYGDGDQYVNSKYIIQNGRISPNELNKIEDKYNNIICLLNSKCIQIPGKIFYDIDKKKNILVILDGLHKKELMEYLKSYNRFILVDNNVDSIISGIKKINDNPSYDLDKIKKMYSPEKIAKELIK